MDTLLHSEFPDKELSPKLPQLAAGAIQIDVAVAFMTKRGVEALRSLTSHMAPGSKIRLIVSVLFPTNLKVIAQLAKEIEVYIHLGRTERSEKLHHQFHSKLVLVHKVGGAREIIIGSHNWTTNGLDGGNIEASVIVSSTASDQISKDAWAHIEACQKRCEKFDSSRLEFYQAIQRKFHPNLTPLPVVPINGFEKAVSLVVMAETDHEAISDNSEVYFHLPSTLKRELDTGDKVWIFLFSSGTLFGGQVTASKAVLRCVVQTKDVGLEHTIRPQVESYAIDDLLKPVLRKVAIAPSPKPPMQMVGVRVVSKEVDPQIPLLHSGRKPAIRPLIKSLPEREVYKLSTQETSKGRPMPMVPIRVIGEVVLKSPFKNMLPPKTSEVVRRFVLEGTEAAREKELMVAVKPSTKRFSEYAELVDFVSDSDLTAAIYGSLDGQSI